MSAAAPEPARRAHEAVVRLLPPALLVLLAVAVGAGAEVAVNDDWQYAHVAKRFAETGKLVVDVPVAPSLVGQSVAVYPALRLFGFSHALLRLLTLGLGVVCLVVCDAILREVGVRRPVRLLAGLALALAPLYAYLSLSFMTEIWGLVLPLAAVWLWLRAGRDRAEPPLWAMVACALLIGTSFWIRQYGALFFPALAGAALLGALIDRRLLPTLVRLLPATLVFAAVVAGYFVWSRQSGNYRPEFGGPFAGLLKLSGASLRLQPGIFLFYATWFCLPLLVLVRWQEPVRPSAVLAVILIGVAALTLAEVPKYAGTYHLSGRFPFLPNVLHETGIGPLTLSELDRHRVPAPQPWTSAWSWVEAGLLVGLLLWTPFAGLWQNAGGRARTLVIACLLLALGNLVVVVQAYKLEVFDRYHLNALVALLLAAAVGVDRAMPALTRRRFSLGVVALLPAALYAFIGLRDQFVWLSARAEMYQRAIAAGVSPRNLDGGYELNGWFAFAERTRDMAPTSCRGRCGTRRTWFIQDDSHRITFHLYDDHVVEAERTLDTWMMPLRKLRWTKRRLTVPGHQISRAALVGGVEAAMFYRLSPGLLVVEGAVAGAVAP